MRRIVLVVVAVHMCCLTGLLFAGDWVGPEGMLADAALASAREAASRVAERGAGKQAA